MRVLHQMTPYEPGEHPIVFQDTSPVRYLHNHRETQFLKEADTQLQVPPDYVDSTARIMVDVRFCLHDKL